MPAPVLRSDASARAIRAALADARKQVPVPDLERHVGVIRLREEPRAYQDRARAEWDEQRPR